MTEIILSPPVPDSIANMVDLVEWLKLLRLWIQGAEMPWSIATTTNTVLTASDWNASGILTVIVDASGGNRIVTLPNSSTVQNRIVTIKKTDPSTNTVTIDGHDGTNTGIDGAFTLVFNLQYQSFSLQSIGIGTDPPDWYII
jgi:hypothetical protein